MMIAAALIIYILVITDSQQYLMLDEFCSQLVSGNYSYSQLSRVQKYMRICRAADKYLDCFLKIRAQETLPPMVQVEPYERTFPSEYDLRRATYTFCAEDLVQILSTFQKDVKDCDKESDGRMCKNAFVDQKDLERLGEAWRDDPEDENTRREISCNIMATLKECVEDQYVRCEVKYRIFRDYELATLGGECLQANSMYSPYVLDTVCDTSSASSLHAGDNWVLTAITLPVTSLWTIKHMAHICLH